MAARFGVSPLTVQRRLMLAVLSPKLMALTLTDDHAAQEANWFEVPQWEQSVAAICAG